MNSWPLIPGVPAAGHVTGRGYWHPGGERNCHKCHPPARSITCPQCGRTSHHWMDVREGYCGHCHDWTSPRSA